MSFTIEMSHPLGPASQQGGYGGPGVGGHQGPHWYIAFGMDLAAPAGTSVFAAFDAHLTKVQQHVPAADTGAVKLDVMIYADLASAGPVLKGHKSVGGLRASTYNAMPKEGVVALVDFLKKFEAENK